MPDGTGRLGVAAQVAGSKRRLGERACKACEDALQEEAFRSPQTSRKTAITGERAHAFVPGAPCVVDIISAQINARAQTLGGRGRGCCWCALNRALFANYCTGQRVTLPQ